jgi:hypothetical protein
MSLKHLPTVFVRGMGLAPQEFVDYFKKVNKLLFVTLRSCHSRGFRNAWAVVKRRMPQLDFSFSVLSSQYSWVGRLFRIGSMSPSHTVVCDRWLLAYFSTTVSDYSTIYEHFRTTVSVFLYYL